MPRRRWLPHGVDGEYRRIHDHGTYFGALVVSEAKEYEEGRRLADPEALRVADEPVAAPDITVSRGLWHPTRTDLYGKSDRTRPAHPPPIHTTRLTLHTTQPDAYLRVSVARITTVV